MSQTLFKELLLNTPLPLTLHPARVYLRSLSPGSLSTMAQSLNAIANLLTNNQCDLDTLDWASLRYQHTASIQAALMEKYAPATAKKMMCALKRVLREARKLGLMNADDYTNAIDLPAIKSSKKLRGRALTQSEITKLINACQNDSTPQGARDAALIAILRGGGLRRAEVVKLRMKDYHLSDGALDIIESKGETGVDSFSPHDFRRTFCSDLLDAGVDIVTVQKLAGHSSPDQTSKYDRRGEETLRQAVQHLGF